LRTKLDEAPSNQAIVGRYILPNRVLELLKTTASGAGGEIQLTDAMLELLKEQSMEAFSMSGTIYVCGNNTGLLEANLAFGLKHPETGDALREFLKSKNMSLSN
jgi:UTP--glucose-1-phosphate uridylyltransferase